MGVVRHVDAGYERAIDVARERGVHIPMLDAAERRTSTGPGEPTRSSSRAPELTVADVESVALGHRGVRLDSGARERVAEARAVIDRLVASGEVVYGVTTGFGSLATTFVPPERARELQERLLLSHAAGVGEPLPTRSCGPCCCCAPTRWPSATRAAGPELIERLCGMLERGLHPVVPSQGSVGASGDLAPLAHLALPLIGHGRVELDGRVQPAAEALAALGLAPLVLEPKEGLALLNGTQMMTAIGALAAGPRGATGAHGQRGGGHDARRRCAAPRWPSAPPTSRRVPTPARCAPPPSCAGCCATASCSARITPTATASRIPTRSAACPRSTAPPATPWATCTACSTSR